MDALINFCEKVAGKTPKLLILLFSFLTGKSFMTSKSGTKYMDFLADTMGTHNGYLKLVMCYFEKNTEVFAKTMVETVLTYIPNSLNAKKITALIQFLNGKDADSKELKQLFKCSEKAILFIGFLINVRK